MINITSLSKNYGLFEAIQNISFQVKKGDVVGFLGPNGAGKTTTMRILCGCIGASFGSVLIDGIDMFENPVEAKRKIGYLPEVPPVYPNMTVFQYLIFSAQLRHVTQPEVAAQRVITTMDLEDVQDRIIGHLSKGFRQRVGLAQALIHDPEILVLDEPVSGLDPKQRKEVRDLIQKLAEGQRTIILSTHVLSEVEAICNRVIVINQGHIVARDNLHDLQKKSMELELKVARPNDTLLEALKKIDGVINVRFQGEPRKRSIDKIHNENIIVQENTTFSKMNEEEHQEEEHQEEVGSYFIITQNNQIREYIAKTAVDYGILEFTSSNNLEDIYLRLLQKSAISNSSGQNDLS